MINSLVDNGVVTDFDVFKAGIMAREAQTSTGLGDGIAMPHSKNAAVKEATVLFAKSNKGVDYESLDGQPTDLFFMIAVLQREQMTLTWQPSLSCQNTLCKMVLQIVCVR